MRITRGNKAGGSAKGSNPRRNLFSVGKGSVTFVFQTCYHVDGNTVGNLTKYLCLVEDEGLNQKAFTV